MYTLYKKFQWNFLECLSPLSSAYSNTADHSRLTLFNVRPIMNSMHYPDLPLAVMGSQQNNTPWIAPCELASVSQDWELGRRASIALGAKKSAWQHTSPQVLHIAAYQASAIVTATKQNKGHKKKTVLLEQAPTLLQVLKPKIELCRTPRQKAVIPHEAFQV